MPSLGLASRSLLGVVAAALLITGLLAGNPAASARPVEAPASITADDPVNRGSTTERATYAKCWRKHRRCFSAVSVNMFTGKPFLAINKMKRKGAVNTAQRKCRHKRRPGACRKAGG